MGMIYWSTLSIEEEVLNVKEEINRLGDEIRQMDFKHALPLQNEKKIPYSNPVIHNNLLTEDPFYQDVLPNHLLPKDFIARGTLRLDTLGKPNNLHPFTNIREFAEYISHCSLTLASLHYGSYKSFAPELAESIEEKQDEEGRPYFLIRLRKGVFWQPLNPKHFPKDVKLSAWFLQKHEVTAHDVKFYLDAIMNPFVSETGAIALRNQYEQISLFEVLEDHLIKIQWDSKEVEGEYKTRFNVFLLTAGLQPLPSFVYKYFPSGVKIIKDDQDADTYRHNSVWAEQFSSHFAKDIIVSAGPWIFDGMSDRMIRFKRNKEYFNPYKVLVENMEVSFKDSVEAMWQDFQVGLIDYYPLNSQKYLDYEDFLQSKNYLEQKEEKRSVQELDYMDKAYSYVGWNQKRVFFHSKNVRLAMTYAIDRKRLILQNLNGMGIPITGTFAIDSPAFDPLIEEIAFDKEAARELLTQEGWIDHDGDGIRDKIIDGKKVIFQFTLKYFVKNPLSKKNCESIRSMLLDVGVDAKLEGLDIADLIKTFDDKDFDAIYFGWALGVPPEDPKQIWHSKGAEEKGSSNAIGFQNKEIDEIIDTLVYEEDSEKRTELYHRFNRIIYEEQPYTFLFSPKLKLLYREYVKNIFLPKDLQPILPQATILQPDLTIIWLDVDKQFKE